MVNKSNYSVNKEYFIKKMHEKNIKRQERKENRIFCWNSIKSFWVYLRNKRLRKYTMNSGIVLEVQIIESGTGYIKNKNVCTFDEHHTDCETPQTMKVDLELGDGKIISAKPSKKHMGYFYQPGDIVLVKGGHDNGFLKIIKVWPTLL
jgi:hypothetical protein